MHHLTCGISSLLHSVNLILFTLLLVHLFLRTDYHLITDTTFALITFHSSLFRRLQSVQNAAARLVTGTRRLDHITPVLRQLHWLLVRQRVDFKLALLVYKALHDTTAAYLVDDCQLVSHAGRRQLRSADIDTCCVPHGSAIGASQPLDHGS